MFTSVGKAALETFEVPEPRAGEVLLENIYTVISAGTERANLMNEPNTRGSEVTEFSVDPTAAPSEKFP